MEGYLVVAAGSECLEMVPEFPCSTPPSSFHPSLLPKPRAVKYRSTCDNCHRLKVKCGQEKDVCSRCRSAGEKCVYGISQRRGKPKGVRDAAASRRKIEPAHKGLQSHATSASFKLSQSDKTMAFQMQLSAPPSPAPLQHHPIPHHRFHEQEPRLGDYSPLNGISPSDLSWDTIIQAEPERGKSLSPGAGPFPQSHTDGPSCSPLYSVTSSSQFHPDTLSGVSIGTHIAESIAEPADQSSLASTVPPLALLPSSSSSHPQPSHRCDHEAFLLEKLVRIEANSNEASHAPLGSTRPEDLDNVRKHSLSFERLLSLGRSALPPPTTQSILSCNSCIHNPFITLYFVLLIDKVLALYTAFVEIYCPFISPTDLSQLQGSTPPAPASTVSTSPASWPNPSPPVPGLSSPQLTWGTPAPFLKAYMLSSTEQTAVLKLLLKSRLGDLQMLINKLRSRMNGEGYIEKACESLVYYVGERLDAVHKKLDSVL